MHRAGQDGHTLPPCPSHDPVPGFAAAPEQSRQPNAGCRGGQELPGPASAHGSTHLLPELLFRHGLHRLDRPLHELHQVLVEQLSGHLSAVGFGKDRVDAVLSTGTAPGLQGKVQMSLSVQEGHSQPFCATL